MSGVSATLDDIEGYQIQEAYQNPDGTFAPPHMDLWVKADGSGGLVVDLEEAEMLLRDIGNWTQAFLNPHDDPRPACRRISRVEFIKKQLSPLQLLGQLKLFVSPEAERFALRDRDSKVAVATVLTEDTGTAIIEAIKIATGAKA